MPQIKIYGLKKSLENIKSELSTIIHNTVVKKLSFPQDKKYHRFIQFDESDMIFPDNKSENYTIIEIIMMEGRTVATKKNLIQSLFANIEKELNIGKTDIEICIIESPACNWGFGGMSGDEIELSYKIEV
mgnify:CR=1 FL=1